MENKEHLSNLPLIGGFDLPRLYKGHAPPAGFVRFLVVVGEKKSLLRDGGGGQKGRGGEANLTHFPGDSAERRLEGRSSEEEVKISS